MLIKLSSMMCQRRDKAGILRAIFLGDPIDIQGVMNIAVQKEEGLVV